MVSEVVLGYISVIMSIIFFGSIGVAVKSPSVVAAKVDPVIFQLYYSTTIFITTWILLIYVDFTFTYWGIVTALLWVPGNILGFHAVYHIGIALAQGIWCGVTIVVAFLWGAVVFQEPVTNWYLTLAGVIFLVLGIVGISLCNFEVLLNLPPYLSFFYYLPFIKRRLDVTYDECELDEATSFSLAKMKEELCSPSSSSSSSPFKDWIIGISYSVLFGLLNGSMLVPMKFVPEEASGIAFVYSIAIGIMIVTPLMALIYFSVLYLKTNETPQFHFTITLLPAFMAGSFWSIGNYFSIYATMYLGLAVGFPLTQVALLVAGIWGMLLFKEITHFSGIVQFFISAVVLLFGSFLLAIFG